MDKQEIIKKFHPLFGGTGGFDSWISDRTPGEVFLRLAKIDEDPLPRAQLNQLLVLSGEAGVSRGFFSFYWGSKPDSHPYDLTSVAGYRATWKGSETIRGLDHLRWGLHRFYIDALLYFGNVRQAYRELRTKTYEEISAFFERHCVDAAEVARRGPPLALQDIAKDNRYLISEMACKSYAPARGDSLDLKAVLKAAMAEHLQQGGGRIHIRDLLEGKIGKSKKGGRPANQMYVFSADDLLADEVETVAELEQKYQRVASDFDTARDAALKNTRLYLSMMNDLDVYVATSMRTRADFREMADTCEQIFRRSELSDMHLRYFDPTMSACEGHEDKGLIECLAVKCAKVLVYCAGEKESYGKDAEAAMALSQGKPVIFYCDEVQRGRFYRDVHPLSRLIDFKTGNAVGAMVTSDLDHVSKLLERLFSNKMQYELEQPRDGFLRLKEKLTSSVVRLQTSDPLLRETFWNHYHNRV